MELARRESVPVLAIVRSAAAQQELVDLGAQHVLDASAPDFESWFTTVASALQATAVFDGAGGGLVTRIVPLLPMNATLYSDGFMAGPEPLSFPTNFARATAQTQSALPPH